MEHMSVRKRALLLAIGAAGVVAALSGAMLEGCVAIGFAVEAYVLCCAYLAPGAADDDDRPGPDDPPEDPGPADPGPRGAVSEPEPARVLVGA